MDEKNANANSELNTQEKALSSSDAAEEEAAKGAPSQENEAEQKIVANEKAKDKGSSIKSAKQTKNTGRRERKQSETARVVTKTALRTLIISVAALVVLFAFYILVFPASAGSFCYTVGMKNTSAWLSSRTARKSGDVDDYYATFVRAVDAKNWSIAELAGKALLDPSSVEGTNFTSTEFSSFCDKIDDNEVLSERDFSTKTYVQYNYVYSLAVRLKENDENVFNLGKSYINSGSSYYYASYNPLKAYIDAAIKNKKLDVDMLLEEFMDYYQSYSWRDKIGGDHATAQKYMRQDLKRLVEARMGKKDKDGNVTIVWDEENKIHDFWKDKLN